MPNNDFQNGLIMASIAGSAKDSHFIQSDWNINDNTSLSYIKNRPFYSEKVESDVWEFELPVINAVTYEGLYTNVPMPDADLSQFANEQTLEYDVYEKDLYLDDIVSSDSLTFIKNYDLRKEYKDSIDAGGCIFDTNIPNTVPCLCRYNEYAESHGEDPYQCVVAFGVKVELEGDLTDGKLRFYNNPTHCAILDSEYAFEANPEYTVQVKFKNFRNKVEQVHQIPDKYINWDNYVDNKKWKWEFHIPPMPFSTQPTIVTGNVSKLKADTFYFIKYTDTAETTFKLTYGEDIFVDDTLEFNRNDAWSSSDDYKFIHCISVDTASNTAVFGKPYLDDDGLIPCSIPNNTKSLRIQTSARAVNTDIKNSLFPQPSASGAYGIAILVLADGDLLHGNNYEGYGCYTLPTFDNSNNSVTMKEEILYGEAAGFLLSFASIPVCVIDPESDEEITKITYPRYEGLVQYDANITVADDRRSYNMEGTLTGVCWDPINSVTFENSINLSNIKATYPFQCYSRLKKEDKKLFFKTNEANNKQTMLLIGTSKDQVLTGFSITIEGEVE